METVDNRTFKQKVHEGWVKVKCGVQDTCKMVSDTVKEHPVESFTLLCLVVPGAFKCANSAMRMHMQNKETRYNECDIYDPRTGIHYYTKRPLTNSQKLYLEAEYRSGRSKGDILKHDLHLI